MAATKIIGSYDEVRIDGTDYSDLFDSVNLEFTDDDIDAPSFNVNGYVEQLPGRRAQAIVLNAYYTEELYTAFYSLWKNRTTFTVGYQPDGLRDSSRETYVGEGRFSGWPVNSQFGQAQRIQLRVLAADNNGFDATTGS
jgi:hypothetical protein